MPFSRAEHTSSLHASMWCRERLSYDRGEQPGPGPGYTTVCLSILSMFAKPLQPLVVVLASCPASPYVCPSVVGA